MKTLTLLLFPFFVFVNAFAAGGGDGFEKRKYRDGAFIDAIKKPFEKLEASVENFFSKLSKKNSDPQSAGARRETGSFIFFVCLLVVALSLISAALIWAFSAISFGSALLVCFIVFFCLAGTFFLKGSTPSAYYYKS